MELTWLFDPSPLAVSGQARRHTKPELYGKEKEGEKKIGRKEKRKHCIYSTRHAAAKSQMSTHVNTQSQTSAWYPGQEIKQVAFWIPESSDIR